MPLLSYASSSGGAASSFFDPHVLRFILIALAVWIAKKLIMFGVGRYRRGYRSFFHVAALAALIFSSSARAQSPTPTPVVVQPVRIVPDDAALYLYDSATDSTSPYLTLIYDYSRGCFVVLCLIAGATFYAVVSRRIHL